MRLKTDDWQLPQKVIARKLISENFQPISDLYAWSVKLKPRAICSLRGRVFICLNGSLLFQPQMFILTANIILVRYHPHLNNFKVKAKNKSIGRTNLCPLFSKLREKS